MGMEDVLKWMGIRYLGEIKLSKKPGQIDYFYRFNEGKLGFICEHVSGKVDYDEYSLPAGEIPVSREELIKFHKDSSNLPDLSDMEIKQLLEKNIVY